MTIKRINPHILVILALAAGLLAVAALSAHAATSGWVWTPFGGDQFDPPRESATATLVDLPGQGSAVLVAGGVNKDLSGYVPVFNYTDTALLNYVGSNDWRPTASALNEARGEHAAVLLADGTVLVAGGNYFYTDPEDITKSGIFSRNSAEIFHPDGQNWTWTEDSQHIQTKMATPRANHTATRLTTGPNIDKVLVAGGGNYVKTVTITVLRSCELYDPSTGTWGPANQISYGVMNHTATVLTNGPDAGKVMVVGGFMAGYPYAATTYTQLYDPKTETWKPGPSLNVKRGYHTATLLKDGRVLVVGGQNQWWPQKAVVYDTFEIYGPDPKDPTKWKWNYDSTKHLSSFRTQHAAIRLKDDTVLAAGGLDDAGKSQKNCELFDPNTGDWTPLTIRLNFARANYTATLLNDDEGRVLAAGGVPNVCEIFGPKPSASGVSRPPVKKRLPEN